MKCPKCGTNNITHQQGMCVECRWVYDQEQEKKKMKEETVSLDDFIAEEMEGLKKFKEHWLKMNKKDPEMYPMDFPADDAGLWWEMYFSFSDEGE